MMNRKSVKAPRFDVEPVLPRLIAVVLALAGPVFGGFLFGDLFGSRAFAQVPATSRVAVPTPASATRANPETLYQKSIAAGYKALALCSGQFNAGRSADAIGQDELSRIYTELRAPIADLGSSTDDVGKAVSVPFGDNIAPRIAAWRPVLGCTLLPVGATTAVINTLPRTILRAPDLDAQPWPLGDQNALAGPSRLSSARINVPVGSAFDRLSYGLGTETTAVIVVRNGKIVAERYRLGFNMHMSQRTWSVAKSLTAAIMGIAADRGIVDLAAPATIPEWRRPGDPRASITFDQLLRMASGLWSGPAGNRTDAVYFGGSAVAETATSQPLVMKPGSHWEYANNDILLAMRALRSAIGDDSRFLAFPYETLFWRVGMTRTFAETDWAGDFVLSSQVWSTARDLARFGLLLLNRGRVMNEQVLSAVSVNAMLTPAGPQPDGKNRPGYGRGIWLFGPDQGLPAGTFAAQGNRGQYVVVVPAQNVVIVRRGYDAVGDGQSFDIARFSADILAALK